MSGSAPLLRGSALRQAAAAMRPEGRRLALASLLATSATLCAIGLLAVSAWLISRASQMPPVFTLTLAIVAVRGFGIGRGFFRYAERLVAHDAVLRGLAALRVAVWSPLERLAPHGLDAFRRGDLLARFVADVDAMQEFALRVVLPVVTALLASGVSVVVAWWLLPAAGAVLLTVLILGATVVPLVTVLAGGRAERETAPTRGELFAQVRTLLVGAADLLAAGSAHAELHRTLDTDAELLRLRRRAARSAGVGTGLGVVLAGTAVIGALLAGIAAVDDGRLDGVNLAVVVLLPLAAYEAVATLPSAALTLVRVRGSAQRVSDLLDTTPSVIEPEQPLVMDVRALQPVLRLRGVTVTWSLDTRPALSDFDLDLALGARVAVVGASGAGKSTLASVLVRFVDYQGSVTLDGHELRDLDGDAAREVVTLVSQDAHVFDSTIAENLRIGAPDASDHQLAAVLSRVRLDRWAASLPDGTRTSVGEHGSQLSGGQRQRLGLARALLADRPVLVLDEPTEHLDLGAAAELTADLLRLTAGRTTVLITHRLEGLETMDEIVVLDRGMVVQRGHHAELVELDGLYRREWLRQQDQRAALLLADALRLGPAPGTA